jgi:hypothetical protein
VFLELPHIQFWASQPGQVFYPRINQIFIFYAISKFSGIMPSSAHDRVGVSNTST